MMEMVDNRELTDNLTTNEKLAHIVFTTIIKIAEDVQLLGERREHTIVLFLFSFLVSNMSKRTLALDCGQVSINISKPGITKVQHWHNFKWEQFIVVSGHGLIQERNINTGEKIEFEVRGDNIEAI